MSCSVFSKEKFQRGDAYEPRNGSSPAVSPHEQRPTVETVSASDLVGMTLPEPRFAVPDVIPEGLSILAGKPKLGKSWLALLLGIAVADGGVALGSIEVEAGPVLYLALEDTRRRLQGRLKRILSASNGQAPAALTLATSWKRQDKGGLADLLDWLEANEGARLIIIDTWAKFRPVKTRNRDSYEEDYEHATHVKALADKYGCAILALTHCRKMDATDPVDSVSGTLGFTGCADGVLVLKRERGQHDATLFVTGRDIDEQETALQWDPKCCLWTMLGGADEYRISRERADLLRVLRDSGRPMKPAEIADALGKSGSAVRKLLFRMKADGWISEEGNGTYAAAAHGEEREERGT